MHFVILSLHSKYDLYVSVMRAHAQLIHISWCGGFDWIIFWVPMPVFRRLCHIFTDFGVLIFSSNIHQSKLHKVRNFARFEHQILTKDFFRIFFRNLH